MIIYLLYLLIDGGSQITSDQSLDLTRSPLYYIIAAAYSNPR